MWAGHKTCIESFARFITGSSDKWQPLSSALVDDYRLSGAERLRQARSPVKRVKGVANSIAEKESRIRKYAVDPLNEPEAVSL